MPAENHPTNAGQEPVRRWRVILDLLEPQEGREPVLAISLGRPGDERIVRTVRASGGSFDQYVLGEVHAALLQALQDRLVVTASGRLEVRPLGGRRSDA